MNYDEVVQEVASRFSQGELQMPVSREIAHKVDEIGRELIGSSSFSPDDFLYDVCLAALER